MASGRLSKVKGKVLDIPNPPTIGAATAGGESVSIAFTAYSGGAGGPTRSYIAKSNPGNITATGSTSPINVTGLTAGTSYTISVAGVNETGTGEYSSASGSAVPTVATSYESIATVTAGSGGSSTITFSSIPSDYTHLQVRGIARTATNVSLVLRFNSDTASNYSRHYLNGNGASVGAGGAAGSTSAYAGTTATGTSAFGASIIDILDYKDTNKYKTVRALSGGDNNGSGFVQFMSGSWRNTNAVTSIDIFQVDGDSFTQYSSIALYGIKGS